jgi:diacylglycerol O-acyltransferase
MLALESHSIAGHTLKLMVIEPGDGPLDLEALRANVAERLASAPRGRQRVDLTGSEPSWVDDERFDIEQHVRRRPDTECASEADVWRAAGELMSERLDHSRPLWTFDLLGPLPDGREAIVARVHHAMADGVSFMRYLDAVLWDPLGEPGGGPASPKAPRAVPPRVTPLTEARRMPGAVFRELAWHGSRSPFDRPVGSSRELAFAIAPLSELRAIGHSRPHHATVNDVLLAVVAGALREWLTAGHEALPRLRAQVPVSLHHRDEGQGELGNRDSFLNVDLPLDDPDPIGRLDRVSAETAERKRLGDAEELYDLFHALGRFKHLGRAAERLAGSPQEFSLSISNVPGPRSPVGVAGRPVESLCSAAEPAARHALRISAVSCAGAVGIGLCTDPEALPELPRLADAIERSFAELRAATLG